MSAKWAKARERIAWDSPVVVLGGEAKGADSSIANATLLKPDLVGRRRKCHVGEYVEIEWIEGLGERDLHAMANGPCMQPLRIYLPDGKITQDELSERERQQREDAGIP
ncbi:MAG: hypothetical protein AAFR88_11985 [Pseudomonadota bacterium]